MLSFYAMAGIAAVLLVATYVLVSLKKRKDLNSTPTLLSANRNVADTEKKATSYTKVHEAGGGSKQDRVDNAFDMINSYYDLSTDFYEWGWGENFHFGVRSKGESFAQSLITHEHVLASRLQLDPGARVLDLGCGVGGPMRNIAKFSGLRVTGINNNDYQLKRLTAMNKARGLDKQCEGLKGNFMDLEKTIPRGTYDGAYAIEATCHAPDRTKCFSEVFASIKPGGRFVCYEWVMTDKYNPRNAYHKQLKDGIELGNALPDITDAEAVRKSLQDAGFNVVEVTDVAPTSEVTWYEPFEPKWTLQGFKTTPVGIKLTNMVVKAMELVKLAPKGSAEMHNNLSVGAITLYEAGRLGIFTPMLLCVAEKPL